MDRKRWLEIISKRALILTDEKDVNPTLYLRESFETFKKFAKLGFLMTDLQDGRTRIDQTMPDNSYLFAEAIDIGCKNETSIQEEFEKLGGHMITNVNNVPTLNERAYVCGVLHTDIVKLFIHFFNKGDKIAFANGGRIPVTYEYANNVAEYDKLIPTEVPFSTGIPVGNPNDVLFEMSDVMPRAFIKEVDTEQFGSLNTVTCIDPQFGRKADGPNGLHMDILLALQKANDALNAVKA